MTAPARPGWRDAVAGWGRRAEPVRLAMLGWWIACQAAGQGLRRAGKVLDDAAARRVAWWRGGP